MSLSNVHLTPQLVQAVRDTIDVAEIAAQHTRLEKKGNRLWGLCPFHKEKTPSFSVQPIQGLYYCFGCGAGGDAIGLHMSMSGDDFPTAIETLAREYGIPLPSVARSPNKAPERDIEEVLLRAETFFVEQLRESRFAASYLAKRSIPEELVERFHLGYAPDDFEALLGALRDSFPLDDLEAAGLIGRTSDPRPRPYDRFRHRLIFPIRNPSGRLVGFGGRTLGDDRAKYINSRETDRFRKRTLLYGLDVSRRSVREESRILLVEGYFDLLASVACGVDWVVATMGTALSPEQARLCSRYADQVVLCYDGDEAGQEAQRRALPILLAQDLEIRQIDLGAGRDPDDLRMEEGPAALSELLASAEDAIEVELARILPPPGVRDPAAQSRSAKAVRELLNAVPDQVLRFSYGRRAADRLGIPVEVLWKARMTPAVLPESTARSNRVVTSLEERALQLLLEDGAAVPEIDELPPADAFLDRTCGNIYRDFLALYKAQSCPPSFKVVLAGLSRDGETLDRFARILLEEAPCSESEELKEVLCQLSRRWQQHRLRTLAQEIQEAQRKGDACRLQQLVEEKTSVTRLLHALEPRL